MSAPVDVKLSPLAGTIQFIGACPPPLEDGDYRLTVRQDVSWDGAAAPESFSSEYDFTVAGPRFTLDPGEIHSSFPPPGQQGHFAKYLPHVVLNRRSLPWERSLDGRQPSRDGPHVPWLAVLGFGTDAPEVRTVTVAEVLEPTDPKVFRPPLSPETGDDPASQCMVVDLPVATFQALAPSEADLPLLGSARLVSVDAKEITPTTEDGWFSVVVCNRFPEHGARNMALLVSLEGFKDHLPGGAQPIDPEKYSAVRLVVFAGWSFTSTDRDQSFADLMRDLDVDRLQLTPRATAPSDEATTVAGALAMGYTAYDHVTREGERTVSWYRGPLQPMVDPLRPPDSYDSSDAALRYDPATGMFDISYAGAWEIGRLLALHDARFAAAVLQWRNDDAQMLHRVLGRRNLYQRFRGVLGLPIEPAALLGRGLLHERTLAFFRSELGPALLGRRGRAGLLGALADPTGLRRAPPAGPGGADEPEPTGGE